jgi:hypothetical protein
MGARNPKVVRVLISLNEDVDGRLVRVCDRLGMNKGTMAALSAALGLSMLEQIVFAAENMAWAQAEARGPVPFDMEALQAINSDAGASPG